jgi:CubicO group peptidase (beta-lactamase class C family)
MRFWTIRSRYTLAAAVVVMACGSEGGPTGPDTIVVTPTPGLQGFPARLDSLRVQLRIPGMSSAIVKDGEIVWARGFGHAIAEASLPATKATPFHLASLTKPFAATIIMQLVEEGLIDLDAPAIDFGVNLASSGVIRVLHLLTHTSEGVPGSSYRYNGDRFGNLDRVILSASGRSFADLLVDRILRPLDLRSTAPNPARAEAFALTGLDRADFLSEMAAGYEVKGSKVVPRLHPAYFGTAAGLVASAEDVAAFSIAVDEGRFLSPETWEEVFTPAIATTGATLPYGLGWFIQEYEGARLQWHYGYWTTNSSLIVRAPDRALAFVVLATTQTPTSPYGLGVDDDVMRSDVAKLFVEAFVLGDEPLPTGG